MNIPTCMHRLSASDVPLWARQNHNDTQIRRKADNENLAEWIVDITTEADRQGSDKFVEIYKT